MILLMGIQGSGKGTQGKRLADAFGYQLLSMGDIIRAHATPEQRERMMRGDLLGDEETTAMLDQALRQLPEGQDSILDGYPRSISQAEWLFGEAAKGRFAIDHVVHLNASEAAVKARLLSRGRVDDTNEAIEKRFTEYHRATQPLFDWFDQQQIPVKHINAERSVDDVNDDLVKLVNQE